ncbi:hypothetical protein VM98_36070, partial [Streptomyces rubellomurinus subsp. indigoferus]
VLGSAKVPEVKFGEVAFSADKFMTDLMNEHVPKKSGRDDRKPGTWHEGPRAAAPAKAGAAPHADPKPSKPAQPEQEMSPEKLQRWQGGLQAIGALAQESLTDPFEEDELRTALA